MTEKMKHYKNGLKKTTKEKEFNKLDRIFKIIEENEKINEKSVEEFSFDEIKQMFNKQKYSNVCLLRSFLVKYFNHLVMMGDLEENIFNKGGLGIDNLFTEEKILITEHEQKKIFTSCHEILAKFIFSSLYDGLSLNDLAELKIYDVDIQNKSIKTKSGHIIVSDRTIELIPELLKESKRLPYDAVRKSYTYVQRYKDYLIKINTKNKFNENNYLTVQRRSLSRYSAKNINEAFNINADQIRASGLVNYVMKYAYENNLDINDESLNTKAIFDKILEEKGMLSGVFFFKKIYKQYINQYKKIR